ncbi:hypothetical protein [Neosynechococcus sphagnicola]|uniref:alpha-2-macroglobulin family protein n=1 Tax=Neosynechococcus sphagnicola TaxID=1501145 RepID=UPI0030840B52
MALAALGDPRSDYLAEIYDQRLQLDQVTQIKLARYLTQINGWQAEAAALTRQLQETIYQTGRTAVVNLPQGWGWLNSPTTAQAQALRLLMARQSSPEIQDRLLRGLLSLRRQGTWPSTYDNAEALSALVAYSQEQSTPPDIAATVRLAGKQLGAAQFHGYTTPSSDLKVPMSELPRGRQTLEIKKSGRGTLHYLMAYRYRLQGRQPGQFQGLRVTREVRPANQTQVLERLGLYGKEDIFTINSGQVFDIGLEIITDHPVEQLLITDPLPAGLEAIDTRFQTATPYFQSQQDSWRIAYQTLYKDRVVAYADRLEPGVYSFHYLVRSVTPGTFLWPGAVAQLRYSPEEFGRTTSSTLVVNSPPG